jgi:hypothetical protein
MPTLLAPLRARPTDGLVHKDAGAAGVRSILKTGLAGVCLKGKTPTGAWRFVISSETRDLAGDVVVQAGREDVSERIPAQVDHSGAMRDLVGYWTNIQTKDLRTFADLVLLETGLSPAADMVRALLEAGVRMASSIGFQSIKREWIREPDTDEGRITGIRFLRWKLLEASIVVVPANPEALSTAKNLLPAAARAGLDEFVRRLSRPPLSPSRAAAAAGTPTRTAAMTIAERIAEARRLLSEQRAALTAARERLAEDDSDEELGLEVERLVEDSARTERTLRRLGDEQSEVGRSAAPAGTVRSSGGRSVVAVASEVIDVDGRPVRTPARPAPAVIARRGDPLPSADLVVRAALCAYEAFVMRESIDSVLARRYPGDDPTRAVTDMFTRAAQNPALTTVAGWAAELTRDSFGAYMDLLARKSVVPNLPLQRMDFNGTSKLTIPRRNRAATPNLAAAFRREGAPIRVGAISLGSAVMTPKSMAIISTFSNELFAQSTPNIEQIIRSAMITDTAEALDAIFLGTGAGTVGLQPAGIRNGVAAPNSAASAGTTPANVLTDVKARAAQLAASGYGEAPVWIMNTQRWISVKLMQNAMGTSAFPEAAANGTLAGYPVVDSLNVPPDIVILVDAALIPFAGGAPMFNGTDVATIHEEDTTPLPISTAGTPNVVAAPVRSLWQTNASGVRAIWEIDWAVATDPNAGAVQVITGVAW